MASLTKAVQIWVEHAWHGLELHYFSYQHPVLEPVLLFLQELLYTRFVLLIQSDTNFLHTTSLRGEGCEINKYCVDAGKDEMFWLMTKNRNFSMEREKML